MAVTQMLTSSPNTVKLWETKTWLQAMRRAAFGHAMNAGSVYYCDKFLGRGMNGKGDLVTFDYAGKLVNVPVGEGGNLINNTEALSLTSFDLGINVMRVGVQSPNTDTIEQQRTHINFADTASKQISKRMAELIDASFFNQLGGVNTTTIQVDGTTYTGANRTFVQGLNSVIAPTSERIVRPRSVANDESLTSADTMSLDLVDAAIELAETTLQPLERLRRNQFHLYLHNFQLTDLKRNTSAGINWFETQLARVEGAQSSYLEDSFESDMICVGEYNNTMIYAAPRVATGQNSSNSDAISTVRRAVLVGADSCSFGSPFGGRNTDNNTPVKYYDELVDLQYYKAIEGRFLGGLKKMSPTGKQDLGVIVISTYAAQHY